ncbi:hypothetical protein [Streptomyces caniscabiei]|uniref:hypothetical protein n=1 Tax=Streptomyces caniscabiei TaxID=2746961 RepID=UPI0018FE35D8|nr:hypothetical protein [Streptomyces caniscabiei]
MAHQTPDDAKAATMAVLFDPEPERWGLRGDPHLWRAMRAHLTHTEVPPSYDEATALLRATFDELTALDRAEAETPAVYREQYAHGGMSSGMIHLDTWRTSLLPLLAERARALTGE